MKINSINLFSYNNLPHKNTNNAVSNQNDNPNNIKHELNVLEVLGRSQVKFTGINNNESDEFDKTFYDDISKKLELSDKDMHKFKKIVNKFLKTNNLSSTEDLCSSFGNEEIMGSFIENVAEGLDFSDEKVDILCDFLFERAIINSMSKAIKEDESLADVIIPLTINSMKNGLVCDKLIEKYNLDEQEKHNINSHLQKLEKDISPEQIAYEITDDYNLSSLKDYNYVLKTIKSRDELFTDFMANNNFNDD